MNEQYGEPKQGVFAIREDESAPSSSRCYRVDPQNRDVFMEPNTIRQIAERMHVMGVLFGYEYGMPDFEFDGQVIKGGAHAPSVEELERTLSAAVADVCEYEVVGSGRFRVEKLSEGRYSVSVLIGSFRSR